MAREVNRLLRPEGLYEAAYPVLPALVGGLGGLLLAPLAAWDLGRRVH